jgi:amino acid transporter
MIKKNIVFKYLSNAAWLSGSAIAVYVLIKAYFFSGGLEAGACPLVLQQPWIILAIGLLVLSFVFSLFEPKKVKTSGKGGEGLDESRRES